MLQQLLAIDEPHPIGHLLRAGDLLALPVLQDAHELGRLQQRIERAGVEPGVAAPEPGDLKLAPAPGRPG